MVVTVRISLYRRLPHFKLERHSACKISKLRKMHLRFVLNIREGMHEWAYDKYLKNNCLLLD